MGSAATPVDISNTNLPNLNGRVFGVSGLLAISFFFLACFFSLCVSSAVLSLNLNLYEQLLDIHIRIYRGVGTTRACLGLSMAVILVMFVTPSKFLVFIFSTKGSL